MCEYLGRSSITTQLSSHLVELARAVNVCHLHGFTTRPLAAAYDGKVSCSMASVVASSATQAEGPWLRDEPAPRALG